METGITWTLRNLALHCRLSDIVPRFRGYLVDEATIYLASKFSDEEHCQFTFQVKHDQPTFSAHCWIILLRLLDRACGWRGLNLFFPLTTSFSQSCFKMQGKACYSKNQIPLLCFIFKIIKNRDILILLFLRLFAVM
jgi:hypothetical protein